MAIGKVGRNGTLNENGAFYSVQDVNVLLENSEGDLPAPTAEDVGKSVVVGEDGKYTLGEAGGGNEKGIFYIKTTDYDSDEGTWSTIDKTYSEIREAVINGYLPILCISDGTVIDYTYYFNQMTYNSIRLNNVYKSANNTVGIQSVAINQDGTIIKS